jgi:hypothetical protein
VRRQVVLWRKLRLVRYVGYVRQERRRLRLRGEHGIGTSSRSGDRLAAANTYRFVSRLAAGRYLDYLKGQKAAITGQSGAHANRPELVAVHGYDTKYAMHALRLGLQGIELLSTGRIGYLNFWTRNQ